MRQIVRIGSVHKATIAQLFTVALLIVAGLLNLPRVYGLQLLPMRSLQLSDSQVNVNASYLLGFTVPIAETIGSIKLQICSNSPILGDICTAPSGFDISTAPLSGQTGNTGFIVLPSGTNANTITLTRPPSLAAAIPVTYTFSNVKNPSAVGTYYGRVQTFASADASGPENDHGGTAYSINSNVQVNATVPPYLLLCTGVVIVNHDCTTASGDYINLGNLLSSATSSAQSQLVTATNAQNGLVLSYTGSTMTSGNNIINAISPRDVSRPGASQFGLNMVANTTPSIGVNPQGPGSGVPTAGYNQPNFYQFVSGDTLVTTTTADDFREFTASYIVNRTSNQTVGVYVATITYVCLANF